MTDPSVDPELLELLVCPLTKKPLRQEGEWLVCEEADPPRRYPVRDGIPVMLIDESQVRGPDGEWQSAPEAEPTDET